jgi:hypothetical protein
LYQDKQHDTETLNADAGHFPPLAGMTRATTGSMVDSRAYTERSSQSMLTSLPILAVDRVRRNALKIAKSLEPGPDMTVVELAALFHDMAGESVE